MSSLVVTAVLVLGILMLGVSEIVFEELGAKNWTAWAVRATAVAMLFITIWLITASDEYSLSLLFATIFFIFTVIWSLCIKFDRPEEPALPWLIVGLIVTGLTASIHYVHFSW